MKKVLIDLSHNEKITSFPEKILETHECLFQFNDPSDDLLDLKSLYDYDVLILGQPTPISNKKELFSPQELKNIKGFVKKGGNLLITSSARGDYNFEHKLGSLRSFYQLTGIVQYHYSLLYHTHPENYFKKKWNLLIDEFPDHPIFHNFKKGDQLIFGKATYFSMAEDMEVSTAVQTSQDTYYHSYLNQKKKKLPLVSPIMIANEYFKGKVVVLGTSKILLKDPSCGYIAKDNRKLINGIFNWFFEEQ